MIKKRYIVSALAALLLFASCKEETMTLSLSATLEQPTPEGAEGNKNYLHNEEWIYWEEGDQIKISGEGNSATTFTLTAGEGTRFGVFGVHDITAYTEMCAVYPVESYVDNAITTIKFPAEMAYRSTAVHGIGPDSTFAKGCAPMVAYFETNGQAGSGTASVDFHSVSGLVRMHIYSTSSTPAKVNKITFTSISVSNESSQTTYTAKQLSGIFGVNDIDQNAPYLTARDNTANNRSITITLPESGKTIGGTDGEYLTFYLPLPATTAGNGTNMSGDGNVDESDNRTPYALQMEVSATVNGEAKVFKKKMGVQIQRNTMIKMKALNITEWSDTENPDGDATAGLVGDGSAMRPFQIYSIEDLLLVRNAFNTAAENNTDPFINGKKVDRDTYFSISRSDISLNGPNDNGDLVWDVGIKNFVGHMKMDLRHATDFGITLNHAQAPLFESVSEGGTVEFITLKGEVSYEGTESFAPLCRVNNGKLINCQNHADIIAATNVAGLCDTNYNIIESGANEGTVTSIGDNFYAAGFCLENHGTLQGFSISSSKVIGATSAGLCYTNRGMVVDCMETVQLTDFGLPGSSVNAGGIVYNNYGTVSNCRVNGVLTRGTGECHIGAIVFNNYGVIDMSLSELNVRGVNTMAGIAAYQRADDAEIRNCGTLLGSYISATEAVAGLVAYLQKGSVKNCYNLAEVIPGTATTATVTGGVVAVIGTAEGEVAVGSIIEVNNVYSSHGNFYGRSAASTGENTNTRNDVLNGDVEVLFERCYSPNRQELINGKDDDGTAVIRVVNAITSESELCNELNTGAGLLGATYLGWTIADRTWPELVNPNHASNSSNCIARPHTRRSNADRIAAARAHSIGEIAK